MKTLYVKIERYQKDYKEFANIKTSVNKDFKTSYQHISKFYLGDEVNTTSVEIIPIHPKNYFIACNCFDNYEDILQKLYDKTENGGCVKYVYNDQCILICRNPKVYKVSKSEISNNLTLLILAECDNNNKIEHFIPMYIHDITPANVIKFLMQCNVVADKDTFIFDNTEIVVDLVNDTIDIKTIRKGNISELMDIKY